MYNIYMIKNLSNSLTKKFWNNKIYIWVNVIKIVQRFFGFGYIQWKVVWNKLTIKCKDSILSNEIYMRRIPLMEYINKQLPKYYINIQIQEIKVVNW